MTDPNSTQANTTPANARSRRDISERSYKTLASFRSTLRGFMDFSARAARKVGLTPQHYQAMLALRAAGDRIHTVGDLAKELLLRHHSAVELVDRLEERGLVQRVASARDGRRVELHLTEKGNEILARLVETHRAELKQVGPALRRALRAIARE